MFDQIFNSANFSRLQQNLAQTAAVNADVLEKLTRHNVEAGTEMLTSAVQHVEKLGGLKQPTDVFTLQTEFFRATTELGRGQSQKFTELLNNASEQYKALWNISDADIKTDNTETPVTQKRVARRKKAD